MKDKGRSFERVLEVCQIKVICLTSLEIKAAVLKKGSQLFESMTNIRFCFLHETPTPSKRAKAKRSKYNPAMLWQRHRSQSN